MVVSALLAGANCRRLAPPPEDVRARMEANWTGSARVFISYRRHDSAGYARPLYEDLRKALGDDAVFLDIFAIEPGLSFLSEMERALDSSYVLLVLIGLGWLEAMEADGTRRLDSA